MSALQNMLALLPMPYVNDDVALVTRVLAVCAAEVEAAGEDVERMRASHWIERAYRGADVDKLAALAGARRFEHEPTAIFRTRATILAAARLRGAVTPRQIRRFVYDYLVAMERLLDCTLVPGLRGIDDDDAWTTIADRPQFRPLAFIENPRRFRRSLSLRDTGARVTHFRRWIETNRGLDEAPVAFHITGIADGVTAMPSILIRPLDATGTPPMLIGYRGVVRPGRTLTIEAIGKTAQGWRARATMEGRDVSAHLYSIAPFVFGGEHLIETDAPAAPLLERGRNELTYLAPAFLDRPALDYVSFMADDPLLREAVLEQSTFDHALFPTGTAAYLEMSWSEAEAAAFEVRIPRGMVIESKTIKGELALAGMDRTPYEEIAAELEEMLPMLRAAGVRAALRFEPYSDRQEQFDRFVEPGRVELDAERAPTGIDSFGTSGRFDSTPFRLMRLGEEKTT